MSREVQVRFGIPQPERTNTPTFKAEGIKTIRLKDFPAHVLPSGGMSGIVSESEMYMVQTCRPTRMTWKDSAGKVIGRMAGTWSMIGRFPWEITMPGMFSVDIAHKGEDIGFVEFEVRP